MVARRLDVHRELVPFASRGGAQRVGRDEFETGHRCRHLVRPSHPQAPLLVGLDRHGWPMDAGLSARTVIRIGAHRTSTRTSALAQTRSTTATPPADASVLRNELDDLLTELEAMAARIEHVQARIARSSAWSGDTRSSAG